tara:strand:+ start:57 stop:299 length:243 start_codon:yes stop_codon:yes gene_type:complete
MNIANLLTADHYQGRVTNLLKVLTELCHERDIQIQLPSADEDQSLGSQICAIMAEIRDIKETLSLDYDQDGSIIFFQKGV